MNGTLLDLLKTTAPIDSSGLNVETKLGKSSQFTVLMSQCENSTDMQR